MAVYSKFSEDQIGVLSDAIGGAVSNLRGIDSGISNTIYEAEFDNARTNEKIVIIIHETPDQTANGVPVEQSSKIPDLMSYAADNMVQGVYDSDGGVVNTIIPKPYKWHFGKNFGIMSFPHASNVGVMVNKTVSILPFIDGITLDWNPDKCHSNAMIEQAGRGLAAFHLAVEGFPEGGSMLNPYGVDRSLSSIDNLLSDSTAIRRLEKFLDNKESVNSADNILNILGNEADYIDKNWDSYVEGLPKNVIHGDYFPDNTIITNSGSQAIIDYGNSAQEVELLDIAISINAWVCESGVFNAERLSAFIDGYNSVKPLSEMEMRALPFLGRVASFSRSLLRIDIALNVENFDNANSPEDCIAQLEYWRFKNKKINLDEPDISL